MSDRMSIPLVMRAQGPERLVLAFPVWYRAVMGAILALLVAALLQEGGSPGNLGKVLLAMAIYGLLYQERWTFDAAGARVIRQVGLMGASRSTETAFAAIEAFRIMPHVQGTIPGTEDERLENAAARRGARGDDAGTGRSAHKQPFLVLVMECGDGTNITVDRVSARGAAPFRQQAARLADLCGKPLTES
jgi:hypothetical protein